MKHRFFLLLLSALWFASTSHASAFIPPSATMALENSKEAFAALYFDQEEYADGGFCRFDEGLREAIKNSVVGNGIVKIYLRPPLKPDGTRLHGNKVILEIRRAGVAAEFLHVRGEVMRGGVKEAVLAYHRDMMPDFKPIPLDSDFELKFVD